MKRHRGQLIALLCGCVLWLLCVLYQSPLQTGAREWFRTLSNGALIPGVLFVGVSGMAWIAGEGLFDGIRYSISSMMAHMRGHEKRYATYYDYTKRGKAAPSFPMLLPGVAFLAAAVVFTVLYYLC